MSNPSKKTFLGLEQIIQTIDDAVELGTKSISLSGGEPFLHPDINEIIDYIYDKGVACYVYTSGIVLTTNNSPCSVSLDLLRRIKGKISKLIVNVEAAEENTYNTIMGTSFGGFQMMQDTIRYAVSLNIVVEAHVVPMKLNFHQLPQIITFCHKLGVSRISFLRLVVQGRAQKYRQHLLLSDQDMMSVKKLMTAGKEQYRGNIRVGIPFSDCAQRVNCLTGTSKLDIRYDGKVYPCEAFKNDNIDHIVTVQADSLNERSLKDIYNNSAYLSQIRQLLEQFQSINTCETCMNQYFSKYGKY